MKIQKLLYCSVVAAIAANISITAFAADFTVPTNGTFAQAVTAANARAAGAPTYTIDISGNQTGVTGTFSTSTSISGAGATLTLTGSSLNFSGSAVTNTLNNLNLTGGATPSGGAILNSAGTLTLNNVTVLNNSITAPAGGGGGIHNDASIVITGSTFRGNNGNSAGGGLHNDGPAKIANTLFTENQANNGGGIYNISAMDVTGSNFLNNRAVGGPGGAIHSIHTSGVVTISDSTFTGNTTNSDAGAVYTTGDMNITRSTFDGNSAPSTTVGNAGGAISSRANALNITDVTFKNNSAGSYGGAVAVRSGTTTINGNTSFTNNTSGNGGGAISNGDSFGWGTVSTLVVNSGATFSGNTAKGGTDPISGGGAIGNYNSNLTVNNGVSFSGNSSASSGGAIYIHNQRGGSANILGANFDKNTATQNGGAINVQYGDLTVGSGSSFTNNSATQSGGAINKVSGVLTVEGNTIFSNNTAANGGAIYNSSYDLNLDTTKGDITFTGNKASTSGSDIQTSDTVNIVGDSNTVSMDGGVAGYGSINKNGANTLLLKESSDNTKFIGTFTQNAGTTTVYTDKFMAGTNNINNSNLNLFHSMPTVNINNLNLSNANVNSINNTTNTYNIGTINLTGTNNFTVDVDGAAAKSDRFNVASTSGSGTLHVKNFNMMGAPTDKVIDVEVFTGSAAHMHTTDVTQLATPIYMYNVTTLDPEVRGQADESGHGKGFYRFYTSENKNITDGSAPPQFNPQVHRGQVSTAAMYSSQLAMNNTLFDHVYIDSYEPIARGRKNQYAAGTGIFAPFQFDQLNGGLWAKTYVNFEKLSMTRGLDIDNNLYGQIVGADFCPIELGEGWKFIPTAFIAYNGGHQTFDGVSMYQNGGQGGFLGTFAKHDFIGSVMAYAGGYGNEMSVAGTTDKTGNWFAGTAAKAAYNFHPHRHWTLQPSALISYNVFGEQKWNSNFGALSMNAGMLNGINVAPGLNVIYSNCDEWNVYLTTMYMYNINDQVGGKAGSVNLPKLSMRHGYFEYGIGGTKTFKERLIAWGQVTLRNGGRTGVALQVGLEWKF